MEKVTLNNGVTMSILGLGVYQIEDHKLCEQTVLAALSAGAVAISSTNSKVWFVE